jgi:steroid Delta-isomerase
MTQTTEISPALSASQGSWKAVHARDKAAWLALMTDDVVIEDPIGPSFTNPDGNGIRGKEAVAGFFDSFIAQNNLTVTCEETFPSSSPTEIAHILILNSEFADGLKSEVRGVFTYHVDEAGLITNMRGYWHMDAMTFTQPDKG